MIHGIRTGLLIAEDARWRKLLDAHAMIKAQSVARSRAQDADGAPLGGGGGLFVGAFLERRGIRASIEQDEHPMVEPDFVEVALDLE